MRLTVQSFKEARMWFSQRSGGGGGGGGLIATFFSDASESLFKLCYESVPSQKYKKFCYIP